MTAGTDTEPPSNAAHDATAADWTLLLINPNARKAGDGIQELISRLRQLGPVVAPESLDAEGTKSEIARYANSVARVVIGGGDGSLHAALPAVLEASLPLGVLPLGTANDFARSLGIGDPTVAVDAIIAGHIRAIDVGTVNGICFLNAVGIGLGPKINRELDAESKSSWGVFAYLLHGLRNLREERGMPAVIECDGSAVTVKALQITIGNGIHYGGGMTISADARFDDGLLHVLSIRPQSPWRLMMRGPALRSGNIENDGDMLTFSGKTVSVRTRRPMDVTADGEQVTRTPVECRTIPGALQVYAPPTQE